MALADPSGHSLAKTLLTRMRSSSQGFRWAKARAKGTCGSGCIQFQNAYLDKLHQVSAMLQQERQQHRSRGEAHVFDGFPLGHLGTHSFKRSSVTMMKDQCASTALVGAIAGTTAKTLERVYDSPTMGRKQRLVTKDFAPLATRIYATTQASSSARIDASTSQASSSAACCRECGKIRAAASWKCCPWCTRLY